MFSTNHLYINLSVQKKPILIDLSALKRRRKFFSITTSIYQKRHIHTQYTPTYLYIFFPNRSSKNGFAFGADTLGTRARTCFKQQTKQSSLLAITSSRRNATGKILRQSLLSWIVITACVLPVSFLLVFDACYLGIQWPRSKTWS